MLDHVSKSDNTKVTSVKPEICIFRLPNNKKVNNETNYNTLFTLNEGKECPSSRSNQLKKP